MGSWIPYRFFRISSIDQEKETLRLNSLPLKDDKRRTEARDQMSPKRKERPTATMSSAGERLGGHQRLGSIQSTSCVSLFCLSITSKREDQPKTDFKFLLVSFFCQHRADDIGSIILVRAGEKLHWKIGQFLSLLESNVLFHHERKK